MSRVDGLSLGRQRLLGRVCRMNTRTPMSTVHSMSNAIGCLCQTNRKRFIRTICVPSRSETALYISSRINYGVGYGFYVANGRNFATGLASGRVVGRVGSLPRESGLAGIMVVNVNRPLSGLSRMLGTLRVVATSCKCT